VSKKTTLEDLEKNLWKAYTVLAGRSNFSEYKEFLFGMLFLKWTNDLFEVRYAELKQELEAKRLSQNELESELNNPENYKGKYFYIPEGARWSQAWTSKEIINGEPMTIRHSALKHVKENVGTALNKALAAIENANPVLEDVFKSINFNRRVDSQITSDNALVLFIQSFDKISLKEKDLAHPGLLGEVFHRLLRRIAGNDWKRGSGLSTPLEVVQICVGICDPQEHMSVYDPTVGMGGMLVEAVRYLKKAGGDPET